jgi:hypothetical protein
MNDIVKPKIARRDGLSLKIKLETNIEKIGVVLTRTVAFKIDVSFTADMKKIKCKPRKKLRKQMSFKFFRTSLKLKDFLKTNNIAAKAKQAIISRQKAIENASKFCRNLMKMAAVPKKTPAVMPSVKANFLVLTRISNALFHFSIILFTINAISKWSLNISQTHRHIFYL